MVTAGFNPLSKKVLYNPSTLRACIGCCTPPTYEGYADQDCRCFYDPDQTAWSESVIYSHGDIVRFGNRTYRWLGPSASAPGQSFGPPVFNEDGTFLYGGWETYSTFRHNDWSSVETYFPSGFINEVFVFGDSVYHDGYSYTCISRTQGVEPDRNQTQIEWQVLTGNDFNIHYPEFETGFQPYSFGTRGGVEWNSDANFGGEGRTPQQYTVSVTGVNFVDYVGREWTLSGSFRLDRFGSGTTCQWRADNLRGERLSGDPVVWHENTSNIFYSQITSVNINLNGQIFVGAVKWRESKFSGEITLLDDIVNVFLDWTPGCTISGSRSNPFAEPHAWFSNNDRKWRNVGGGGTVSWSPFSP